MKVLFTASEAVPFIKSGGLADVAHALPKTLRALGVDVRVVLPKYGAISDALLANSTKVAEFSIPVGWRQQYCGIWTVDYDGIPYYFVDNEYYFKRDTLYGHYDDAERFAFFCTAVLEMLPQIDFMPNVLHLNDWHTGMISAQLNEIYRHRPGYEALRTVFTIHNLQYQGIFTPECLHNLLNLPMNDYYSGALEFYGNINFMKAGISFSNLITTVSPSYAEEIQTAYFGEQLDGLMRWRSDSLKGIVNGIDTALYNPLTDVRLPQPYDLEHIAQKGTNKAALQKRMGLPVRPDVPVLAMVTRLADMKGLDLIAGVLHQIMSEDLQLIVLGSGEQRYEHMFQEFQRWYPDKLAIYIGFNAELSHQIYGGADLFLMPSRFEPCGLGQLIALTYGTVPIVRETGGLKDTVMPWNEFTGEGNGFSFANYNAHDMLHVIHYALSCYRNPAVWQQIVTNAMSADNSWEHSAKQYLELYEKLVK